MGHYVHMLYLITATKIIRNQLGALLRVVHNTNHFYFLGRRNIHKRCSIRKAVLKNFVKFTGKHLCQSFFFNKVADLRPKACNFIKKETLAQMLSCEFCKIFKNTFFTEHLWMTASKNHSQVSYRTAIPRIFRKYLAKYPCKKRFGN